VPSNQTRDESKESTTAKDDTAQTRTNESTLLTVLHTSGVGQDFSANSSTHSVDTDVVIVSPDIWSTAYREAVNSPGKDIDFAILG
jgi:hypothetical protein